MSDELPEQYEAFAQYYATDFNASRSAIRAGYSSNGAGVQGFRLLKNAKITARIKEIREEIAESLDVSEKRIIQEYAKIAFTNLEDVVDWLNTEPTLRKAQEISPPAHGAVSEITRTETPTGIVTTKIKLHDKRGALDSLARYKGMFNDKIEHSGTVKTETSFWVKFVPLRKNGTSDTSDSSVSLPPETD